MGSNRPNLGLARRRACRLTLASCVAVGILAALPNIAAASTAEGHGHATAELLVWDRSDAAANSVALIVGYPDGSHQRKLTNPDAGVKDIAPVRSPDGRRVIFERDLPDGSTRIGIVPVTGSSVRFVNTGCQDPCVVDIAPGWTPDGQHITFDRVSGPFDPVTGDASSALLYTERLDGSDLQRLSEPGLAAGVEDVDARFAPNGRYLVFVRDQRIHGVLHFAIFRMNADATDVRQLTPWDLNADRPSISPTRHGATADLISFETHGGAAPTQGDVALMPASCRSLLECTQATRLVTHNSGTTKTSYAATWSPSGTRLAFAQENSPDDVDIWTTRPDGHDRRQITHASAPEFSPAWSH